MHREWNRVRRFCLFRPDQDLAIPRFPRGMGRRLTNLVEGIFVGHGHMQHTGRHLYREITIEVLNGLRVGLLQPLRHPETT